MSDDKTPWWLQIVAATMLASVFAAVPFWARDLTVLMAAVAAAVIFPSVFVAVILAIAQEKRRAAEAEQIKADPALRSIPIIAVTSYALSGEEKKAREAGCDDYVPKPFSPRQLLAKIRQYLS